MPETVPAFLAVGSNLGDRCRSIERALDLLGAEEGVEIVRISRLLETAPSGGPPQGPYLNGAVEVRTRWEPAVLLRALHRVEDRLGRARGVVNGPRTIDLDLLLHGDHVISSAGLELPHPRMLERSFVLEPLAEIAPGARHPVTGRTIAEHLAELEARVPLRVSRTSASIGETALVAGRWRAAGLSIGLVPTMGALHEGHAALFRRAASECERVAATIFVNPTQFGPGEDLAAYPRTPARDIELCRRSGVDLVLLAREEEMYPPGFQTWVTVEELSRPLCGRSRPTHFRGVATVVTQLLAIVRPDRAYFGQKDYQQTRVVRRLAEDLHLGTEIRVVETVREPDGLALSSRNAYLDPAGRRIAPRIYRALSAARDLILAGENDAARVIERLRAELRPGDGLEIDHAELRDAETLAGIEGPVRAPGRSILLAAAAFVGRTRLIDNIVIREEDLHAA